MNYVGLEYSEMYLMPNDDMAEDARLIGIQLFVTTDAGEDT
jgi:hypothetical protein